MILRSTAWGSRVFTVSIFAFFHLNCLAAAEKKGKHKAGNSKHIHCRYGAFRLICGDEHDSLHTWLTWVRSVVFGIHFAAIAKGEIAEA